MVTTTTLALGSKELSHEGIFISPDSWTTITSPFVHAGAIVTRLAAIEDMAAMSILCSDKTGTLTMNKVRARTTPLKLLYFIFSSELSLLIYPYTCNIYYIFIAYSYKELELLLQLLLWFALLLLNSWIYIFRI